MGGLGPVRDGSRGTPLVASRCRCLPGGVGWILYLGVLAAVLYFLYRRRPGGPSAGGSGPVTVLGMRRARGRFLEEGEVETSFEDVAGLEEAKEELREIVDYLARPERYRRLGAKMPRGVLLVGPPGTGKTLLARAVAGEAAVPFVSISGSEFVEMFVGVGAARVRDLFAQARRRAPCIVFIDELDALGRSRSGALVGNEEREQTLNQLLVEMDGFEAGEAVVVIAATNRPDVLDPALLRPGRFDRQVSVGLPDRREREAILRVHARAVPLAEDVDLQAVAARTPGFAGADLSNLVNEAALLAARRDLSRVDAACFTEAVDRLVAGVAKKNPLVDPEERRRVAYHEVGHVLASTLAGGRERVEKVSIVPRGLGIGGFTMSVPEEEARLWTRQALRARLVGLLGGRAAEEIVFGDPSTGAQDDLRRATALARAMVVDYGFSEAVGLVSVGEAGERFLERRDGAGPVRVGREVGAQLADAIDAEVRRLVGEAFARARELLEAHRSDLDRVAEALLREEVLEGEVLQGLLAPLGPGEGNEREGAVSPPP